MRYALEQTSTQILLLIFKKYPILHSSQIKLLLHISQLLMQLVHYRAVLLSLKEPIGQLK